MQNTALRIPLPQHLDVHILLIPQGGGALRDIVVLDSQPQ